jgi:hydroxylamine reductase
MFCYQCEQTSKSVACTVKGVCGKVDEVASLQDALIYSLKGLALVVEQALPTGIVSPDTYAFLAGSLFMTLTNVNFDSQAITDRTVEAVDRREVLKTGLLELLPGLVLP